MKTTHLRVALALAAGTFAGTAAYGQLGSGSNSAPCCQLTTTLGAEAIRGLDSTADERFFMNEGAAPTVFFLLDTSGSMLELPLVRNGSDGNFWNSVSNGCSAPSTLDAWNLSRGWIYSYAYPVPDPGTMLGMDNGFPNLFQDRRLYAYNSWAANIDNPTPLASTGIADKCDDWWSPILTPLQYTQCTQCLAEKGFYKYPGKTIADGAGWFVFTGRWLNFTPPKYVTARRVFKKVIANIKRFRIGYATFDGTNGAKFGRLNPPCGDVEKTGDFGGANRASYVSDINGFSFTSSTPLAESLLNIGQLFVTTDNVYTNAPTNLTLPGFGIPNSYLKKPWSNDTSLKSNNRSWCWGCQITSVVIITDGQPTEDADIPVAEIEAVNGGPVQCPDENGDGVRDCGNGANMKLDDVAMMLGNQDLQRSNPEKIGALDTAGKQTMTVYGIGFADDRNFILKNASEVTGGFYVGASDANELEAAIIDILKNVETRATSFSSSSVSSLQVNKSGGALIPRFRPSRSGSAKPWQGFMYRFELATEFVLGCDPKKALGVLDGGSGGDPMDLNHDGYCDDLHLIDSEGDRVVEDADGKFIKADKPDVEAVPFWEAADKIKNRPNGGVTQNWMDRRIYTIVDTNGDDKINHEDEPLEFIDKNADRLAPYLGIASSDDCKGFATQLGVASLTVEECAALVINWYRGADALSSDATLRDQDRAFLLHDLFHSSPIIVEPPMPRSFCSFTNQCMDNLFMFAKELDGEDIYDKYFDDQKSRDRIALIGSNGGMVHAFHVGTRTGDDVVTGLGEYDAGDGHELWAFVPPDQLPKLKPNLGKHAYFVDASPMVREAWLDGVGGGPKDREKQKEEFRTIAVISSGEGGVHRMGLDITHLIPTGGSDIGNFASDRQGAGALFKTGDFRWMWPQPCDEGALLVGESTVNSGAKAPPIGPVLIEDPDGKYEWAGLDKKINVSQQWVVFLHGGYDKYMARGRGMAMVDLGFGDTVWKFVAGDSTPNSEYLKYPFASVASMVDIGRAEYYEVDDPVVGPDLMFDTATLGDLGGQIWTVRFWVPGQRDPSKNNEVTNWYAARSFEVSPKGDNVREPFTFMTANTVQIDTGGLRTYAGTGDRYAITDTKGYTCRLSNPRGCAHMGCAAESTITVSRGGSTAATSYSIWTGATSPPGAIAKVDWSTSTSGASCQESKIELAWSYANAGGKTECYNGTGTIGASCTTSGGVFSCSADTSQWVNHSTPRDTWPENTARYYGFRSYGGPDTALQFHDDAAATNFDARRYTDSDLVDVTTAYINTATGELCNTCVAATPESKGWFLDYVPTSTFTLNGTAITKDRDERTGSNAAIAQGTVIWNSFEPITGGSVCSNSGANIARLYQADYITGAPVASREFVVGGKYARYVERNVVATPGDPTPQRTVYGGMGQLTIVTLEAGNASGTNVGGARDLLESYSHIEVNRKQHECRHEGQLCK